MTDDVASDKEVQLNRGFLVGGAVLIGVGALLSFAGTLLGAFAILSATRQWVRQLEQPPSEIAKLKLQQARAAASAGAAAWRSGPPVQPSDS